MQTHKIKLNKNYADAVLSGDKNFEVRYNDRGYQKGDRVKFLVVDESGVNIPHKLESRQYVITYLIHGYGLERDWCVFGIRPTDMSDI